MPNQNKTEQFTPLQNKTKQNKTPHFNPEQTIADQNISGHGKTRYGKAEHYKSK